MKIADIVLGHDLKLKKGRKRLSRDSRLQRIKGKSLYTPDLGEQEEEVSGVIEHGE